MTNKLPRQQDVDSQIMELGNPLGLALQLSVLATVLIVFMSWLSLFGLMIIGLVEWAAWPFIAVPIAGWMSLLGLPAFLKARRGALATLDALATTAEAWLARAGYSIDLNSDGYIGAVQAPMIDPVKTEVHTPMVYAGPGGVKLLALDAPTIPPVADQPAEEDTPPTRVLWDLPGGVRCPVETVRNFVERIFIVGWGRGEWVGAGKPLDRETYDALLNLLSQAQIIEGRKAGHAGRLTIDDPQTALKVLNLA
jgi:hypothetical protein